MFSQLLVHRIGTPPCQSGLGDYQWLTHPGGHSSHSYSSVNASIWQKVGVPTPYITHIQYGHLVGGACNSAGYNSYRGHDTTTIAKETGELLQGYTTIKIC